MMNKETDMNKETLIRDQIIAKYFPNLKDVKARHLNVESLIEECIAIESGLTNANDESEAQLEYDFVEDLSDSKTASCSKRVVTNKSGGTSISYTGKITSVETKLGALRCTVFNEYKNCLDFFLIPHGYIKFMAKDLGGKKGQGKKVIPYSYHTTRDTYSNNMEDFRVATFNDICKVEEK